VGILLLLREFKIARTQQVCSEAQLKLRKKYKNIIQRLSTMGLSGL